MMLRRHTCSTAANIYTRRKAQLCAKGPSSVTIQTNEMPCCLLLCQNNNDRIAFCFMFFFFAFIVAHTISTLLAIHRSMLGNSTITRNNDTNAYIMATMNNISAALDSRSMSVGKFIDWFLHIRPILAGSGAIYDAGFYSMIRSSSLVSVLAMVLCSNIMSGGTLSVIAYCAAFSSSSRTVSSSSLARHPPPPPPHRHHRLATTTISAVFDADADGGVSSLLESSSSSSSPSRRRSFLLRHAALAASAVTTTDSPGLLPIRPALAAAPSSSSSSSSAAKNPSSALLRVGHAAPDFELPNTRGRIINLDALTSSGTRWAILYFYPAAFTSGCTLEARKFQELYGRFADSNAIIAGISVDSVSTNAEFCASEQLDFYMLSDDAHGAVSKSYEAALSVPLIGTFANRRTYIVDPNKIVRAIFVNVEGKILQHPQEVLDKLKELQGTTTTQ